MAVVCATSPLGSLSSIGDSCPSEGSPRGLVSGSLYATILFELRRDGIAGVCGVWGEIGFPGDEAVEMDVPAAIGGTPESCLLDELDERCICTDDDIESESAAFESRMR